MRARHRWTIFHAAVLGAALLFPMAAFAQSPTASTAIPQPDLTSAQLDWNPKAQFYWPKKAWNRDPWWKTARTLARVALRNDMKHQPENKAIPRSADSWNRRLLKVLQPQATQESETSAYLSGSGADYVELSMARYRGALPFEIRQSIWVWTFWFPKETPGGSPTMADVRAMLPAAYRSKFVPVSEQGFPAGALRLAADDQPPYFRDMLLFETKTGVILCGSKIMGPIAMIPDHSQTHWFTNPRQQQGTRE